MNRNLDAWIAEHVMGLEVQKDQITQGAFCRKLKSDPFDYFVGKSNDKILHYSDCISAAWKVFEILKTFTDIKGADWVGWILKLGRNNYECYREFEINLYTFTDIDVLEDTAPMAICKAAYKLKTGSDWEDLKDEYN